MLFPNSVCELNRFLRAARITLILIDLCDIVFRPFLPSTTLSCTDDENFFLDILDSLTYLCNWLNTDIFDIEIAGSNDKEDDNDNDTDDGDMLCSMKKLPDATNYYQITYLAD
uniref:Uncharacterized protein n=1 Tax=Setaria digitata TaxID=48799 RepID=A0A915PZB0_9BILA